MIQKTLLFSELNLEEVQELIHYGADVNIMNIYDYSTPLYRFDDVQIIDLLIKNGADINHLNSNNITPLKHHHYRSHDTITQLLIKTGAVPHTVEFYFSIKHLYPKEQQDQFDVYTLLSTDDNDFFYMCKTYKNNMIIEIEDINIL